MSLRKPEVLYFIYPMNEKLGENSIPRGPIENQSPLYLLFIFWILALKFVGENSIPRGPIENQSPN